MDFGRHTPELLNRRLAADPTPPIAPIGETATAVALWCDISGFTPLTERLVSAGPAGVERLTDYLNAYFGRLVDLVSAHGGDVVQFEGDALLAVWRIDEEHPATDEEVLRAVACALEIQTDLHGFDVAEGIQLSQRVVVGVGPLHFHRVGGVLARWTLVVGGAPLAELQRYDHEAAPGQVVITPDAWSLVSAHVHGRVLPAGCVLVRSASGTPAPRPLHRVPLPDAAEAALRVFLSGAVLSRVKAGQGRWLAELRNVSVLFVHLPALSADAPGFAGLLQGIVVQAQHAVYRWGGSITKVSMADKGATLLAGFGVPPLAHEDDPMRAVRAGLDVVERFAALGVRVGVGVTTGQVFCGLLGSDERCEYTTLGRPVNLASRLMQLAEGAVHVDEPTWRASQERLVYEARPPAQLKGFAEPVPVFRATGVVREVRRRQTEIVGRAAELEVLAAQLQNVLRRQIDAAVLIEGEAGIGKSRLAEEVVRPARGLGLRIFAAEAQAIERDTPYFALRGVLAGLFGLPVGAPKAEWQARVTETLAPEPELWALAPLLNEVLPLQLPETPLVREMNSEVRADNTRLLLTRLLARAAAKHPLLLFVEDAQWLDSASWGVVAQVAADVHPLFLLVATRPFYDAPPAEYARLLARPDAVVLRLDNLGPEETLQLVCQRLGVVNLPDEVRGLLVEKSGGNPFFTEELAYALRDSGRLLIQDGTCGLAPGEDLSTLVLPGTVQGVVISRVDRLSPERQLLLKAASVIGREFPVNLLEEVYPGPRSGESIPEMLAALRQLDLVTSDSPDGHTYIFKHAIGQEAIYSLMLFAQRRGLHREVARWYERNVSYLAPLYPLLAHHWDHAEEPPKALDYLEKAGAEAARRFANREAAAFFERALKLVAEHPASSDRDRLRRLEESVSLAYYGAGDFDASRVHGERALALLGRPVARSPLAMGLGLLGHVVRRAFQGRWSRDTDHQRARSLSAARLQNGLAEIAAFREENLRCLYLALRQLNASFTAGPSPELGRAYAVMSTMVGTIPLPRVAGRWVEQSLDIARRLDSRQHRAWIASRCAVYEIYRGHWPRADALLAEALQSSEGLGDRRLHEESLAISGLAALYRGDFTGGLERNRRLVASARASGNRQTLGWGSLGCAQALTRLGRPDEALAALADLDAWLATCTSTERIWGRSLRALALLHAGRSDDARAEADRVYAAYIGHRPLAYWDQPAAPALAEIYWTLLQAGHGDPADLRRRLGRSARTAARFGAIFPFGDPAGRYWTGVARFADARPAAARRAFTRCVRHATARDCAHELALARRALAEGRPVLGTD